MGFFSSLGNAVGDIGSGIGNILGGHANKFRATPVTTTPGATADQVNQTTTAGGALAGQQQALGQQLAGQNGVANQQDALGQINQQAQANAGRAAASNIDYSAANQTLGQGQALLGQVQGVANGTGPNAAQAQYGQNVAQSIQQAAGLVASQKGLNPATAARLAARAGAGMLQQAAGNAATLQAQQQLAAQQQAAGIIAQQAGLQSQQAQAQAGLQSQYAQMGLQGAGMAGNLASTQVGQQIGQLAQQSGLNLQQQQVLQQALATGNQQAIQQNLGLASINSGVAQQNAQMQGQAIGGIFNAVGSVFGGPLQSMMPGASPAAATPGAVAPSASAAADAGMVLAHGGEVPSFPEGASDKDLARWMLSRGVGGKRMAAGGDIEIPPSDRDLARQVLARRRAALTGALQGDQTQPATDESAQPTVVIPGDYASGGSGGQGMAAPVIQPVRPAYAPPRAAASTPQAPPIEAAAVQPQPQEPAPQGFGQRVANLVGSAVASAIPAGAEAIARHLPTALTGYPAIVQHRADLERAYQVPAEEPPVQRAAGGTIPSPRHLAAQVTVAHHLDRLHAAGMLQRLSDGGEARPLETGGAPVVVPGRAEVPGDSLRNDKVRALLSPGEIVLPRSVTKAPDAPEKARDFIEHIQRRRSSRGFERLVRARQAEA